MALDFRDAQLPVTSVRTQPHSAQGVAHRRGEHLSNFPQAFTHIGLISAAYDLDRRLSAAGWDD